MEKESARKQTLEQLYERRKQVVRLHKAAMGIMKIVALTGLTYPTVRSAIDRFEQGGWEALKPKARGRLRGTGRVLSAQQESLIQEQIRDKKVTKPPDGYVIEMVTDRGWRVLDPQGAIVVAEKSTESEAMGVAIDHARRMAA